MSKIRPLVLAGGSGTRLWPLSETNKPKQYHLILNNQMLLTQTLNRCSNKIFKKSIISTNIKHKSFIDEINNNQYDKVIFEETGKNTAASILFACFLEANHNEFMLALPSDHYIPDTDYFNCAIERALAHLNNFNVITFGIKPTYASTQYGYIQTSANLEVAPVNSFHEKPNISNANQMINSGDYLWNSGIFLFKVSTLLEHTKLIDPVLYNTLSKISMSIDNDGREVRINSDSWSELKNVSFDVSIMEKIENAGCYIYEKYWTDLGDWKRIAENSESDLLIDSENSFVKSYDDDHDIVGIGLKDIICIVANNKTLCIDKNLSGEIKNILLKHDELATFKQKKEFRPWGWYESLLKLPNYQIKILHVNPYSELSLQSHDRRSEHWIVLEGTASVQKNKKIYNLKKNESIYLDKKEMHKLWNKSKEPLKIIEVQIGDYLEEDDIIRHDDIYDTR